MAEANYTAMRIAKKAHTTKVAPKIFAEVQNESVGCS